MIRLEKGILFSLILLFVLVSSGLFASDDVIVEDIVFTGLKRTKPGTAFQIIRPLRSVLPTLQKQRNFSYRH